MKKNKTVLLQITHRPRDAQGVLLVYYYLKAMGYKPYLANHRNILHKYENIKPDVVVLSDNTGDFADWCWYFSRASQVVFMPTEGVVPDKNMAKEHFAQDIGKSKTFIKGLAKKFVWGKLTAEWLLEAGIYNEKQLVVTGVPRFDAHMLSKQTVSKLPFSVGFVCRGIDINDPMMPLVQLIERCSSHDNGQIPYMLGSNERHYEDLIWCAVAKFRIFYALMSNLKKSAASSKIVLRPDPWENADSYRFFNRIYTSFEINKDLYLVDFLDKVNAVVVDMSTVGIEALMANKPVISVRSAMGERAKDHMPGIYRYNDILKYYWQPASIEEASHMLGQAQNNLLPLTPYKEELAKFLHDFYDWPRNEPSSLTVAKEIAKLLDGPKQLQFDDEGYDFNEFDRFFVLNKLKRLLPFLNDQQIKWVLGRDLLFDMKDCVKDMLNNRFKAMMRAEFYSWQRSDFVRAKKIWNRLQNETK